MVICYASDITEYDRRTPELSNASNLPAGTHKTIEKMNWNTQIQPFRKIGSSCVSPRAISLYTEDKAMGIVDTIIMIAHKRLPAPDRLQWGGHVLSFMFEGGISMLDGYMEC